MLLDNNLKASDNFQTQVLTGLELFKFLGDFRTKAVDTCKTIIDELFIPPSERKSNAIEIYPSQFREKSKDKAMDNKQKADDNLDENSELIYFINNNLIRISWPESNFEPIPELGTTRTFNVYTQKYGKLYANGKLHFSKI